MNLSVVGSSRRLKCKAKSKRSGERCQRWAVNGALVCPMHGAAKGTPARAKAEEQLRMARDELMEMLLALARDTTQSAGDRLKAITWALERAGFKGGVDIVASLEIKPWQKALEGLFGQQAIEPENTKRRKAVEPRSAAPQGGSLEAHVLAVLEEDLPQPKLHRRKPEPEVIEGQFVNSDDTPPRRFKQQPGSRQQKR